MPKGKKGKRAAAPERAYGRLTRNKRNGIEGLLGRDSSCRRMADELGRSLSTVKREVDRYRLDSCMQRLQEEESLRLFAQAARLLRRRARPAGH